MTGITKSSICLICCSLASYSAACPVGMVEQFWTNSPPTVMFFPHNLHVLGVVLQRVWLPNPWCKRLKRHRNWMHTWNHKQSWRYQDISNVRCDCIGWDQNQNNVNLPRATEDESWVEVKHFLLPPLVMRLSAKTKLSSSKSLHGKIA